MRMPAAASRKDSLLYHKETFAQPFFGHCERKRSNPKHLGTTKFTGIATSPSAPHNDRSVGCTKFSSVGLGPDQIIMNATVIDKSFTKGGMDGNHVKE
jgi:hypothetical protein